MQAVILAAGVGSRLDRVTGGLPKCLIRFGGKPLIEHQLEMLADEGIGKVLVVVGYRADDIKKAVGDRAEYIDNPRYAETNSLYSLWLAREWVQGDFVLLNCDLLAHPDVLERLLAKGGNALAFDSTSTMGQEQTKVAVREGRVIDLGKDLAPALSRGESLGLLCFDAPGSRALFARADALVRSGAEKSWSIEATRAVCSELDVHAVNVAGLPWVELDFPADLQRAQKEVWPAIHASRWAQTIHWRRTKWAALALLTLGLLGVGWVANSKLTREKAQWHLLFPEGGESMSLMLPAGAQTWWLAARGRPLSAVLEGPTSARAELRLLMPAGTREAGRYVVEFSVDGQPVAWKVLKATPDPEVTLSYAVAGDRDRVEVEIPPGTHSITLGILAGTSDRFLARFEHPEPVTKDDRDEEDVP